MSLSQFWIDTDAEQASASASIRANARITAHYAHATAFESWRRNILDPELGVGLPFWIEAQNDFLLSLIHGGKGVWRSALQALRSFVENAVSSVYFSEHPVEARRFTAGDFRLSWTGSKEYLRSYPGNKDTEFRRKLVDSLAYEYSELSAAVHGSAESFRMTAGQQYPKLCDSTPALLGAWQTRVGKSARAVHLLLLQHFAAQLTGARLPLLRADIAKVLGTSDRATVKRELGIVLTPP
jgi:hypothetical protein